LPRIYISSTYEDLKEYREAVYYTLKKNHELRKVRLYTIAMEDYIAQDQRPLQNCLDEVVSCDIYIGMFAWRYGYIPINNKNSDNLSITELEYRKAKEYKIPCLIFLLDESVPWPLQFRDGTPQSGTTEDNINRLRNELEKEQLAKFFKNKDDLATKVSNAVANEEIQHFLD
jgi:hypothetical protein